MSRPPTSAGRALGVLVLLIATALALAVVLGGSDPPASGGLARQPEASQASVWAVGDSADGGEASKAVGAMIAAADPDHFLYLGDVYDDGTREDFANNYEPAFGALDPITLPTPGNHDWLNAAEGYDPYWAEHFDGSVPAYYSVEVAGWDLISLNSEAPHDAESEQWQWLRDELEPGGTCRIAFWHRPRYSAGSHGDESSIEPTWQLLAGRATLALNGHEHNMQRLREIDGITTLISGAGGKSHYSVKLSDERLAFADTENDGALALALEPGSVRWRFMAVNGDVLDRGEASCDP
jgi:hypothetical protein